MVDGTNWVAGVFKLFHALINPSSPPKPDEPAPSQSSTPEIPADNSPASIPCLEPAPEADALARQDQSLTGTPPGQEIETAPVQQDDESRRKLIRQLFNEYWAGVEDKPATFAERLEVAERYINEQLADRRVGWRLDAMMRKRLGLPPYPIAS
jgi:hypothetical protein